VGDPAVKRDMVRDRACRTPSCRGPRWDVPQPVVDSLHADDFAGEGLANEVHVVAIQADLEVFAEPRRK
jgi:hypothetical protein